MSAQNGRSAVTVLGLGPMGRALAAALLGAGLRTTVWNRTPGRDAEAVAQGALPAASAEDAVAASPLTVVCVVNYDASDAVLRQDAVTAALRGRTVVNLSADTPGRARDTAAWAERHGVRYLDGAIMTPTPTIGTPDAVFLHSGPADLYEEHRPALEALGGTHTHLGADPGRAAAFDIALLDIFWTAMSGYAHALALAGAEGVRASELLPFAQGIGAILPPLFAETARELEAGTFPGDGNPLTSALSTMEHVVQVSDAHGIDAGLMRAAEAMARRAVERGHGADGFTRVAETLGGR
ncbi:NAD(P)-dependent oxidoreductase [Streptomyces parvulus]|uniref:NAD(P)-dependent oxidoreductase n=1 Tax=Streptomyces parvulus TaxID=146923 RepID=A0A369UX64_9ACTN|nr:NAD(P)-binding domain-containing protein [Streptomyces parvulus]RDD85382.1 NAD(P)-dependent oxidoreductase [Streptomyces parvulus]